MAIQVPFSPNLLDFGAVEPLTTGPFHPPLPGPGVDTTGGVKVGEAPADTTVNVSVTNLVGTCFALDSVSILEWVLEPVDDGDLPPGWKGPRPRVKVLEVQGVFDGSSPIPVSKEQYVLATVKYNAPFQDGTFTGVVNINGVGWDPISVLLSLFPASVVADLLSPTPITVQEGRSSPFLMRFQSVLGPPVDLTTRMQIGDHSGLFISAEANEPIHLLPRKKVDVVFNLAASQDAPLGPTLAGLVKSDYRTTTVVIPTNVVAAEVPPVVDNGLLWEESTDYALAIDKSQNAWFSGHIEDVALRSDAIFLATSTGGIWGIARPETDLQAGCTTDNLDNPNFTCLAFGPDSPLQMYAGANTPGQLYLRGLGDWRQIPLMDSSGVPIKISNIFRIAVLKNRRAIVLATDNGVYWSNIPGPNAYLFTKVTSLPPGRYTGMAVGPNETVVVGLWGDAKTGGPFTGSFSATGLDFIPATLVGDVSTKQMHRISIASVATNPSLMYAVAAGLDDRVYRILRSRDGGNTWNPLPNSGSRIVKLLLDLPFAPDDPKNDLAGSTGWYTNCIGVDAHNANLVGIGWANGPWLSTDANTDGNTQWILRYEQDGGGKSVFVHADIHSILFDRDDLSGRTIYVGCDGGLMRTFDGAGDQGYESRLNIHLRSLQFYSIATTFSSELQVGGISASPVHGGLIAGPTQDNGNLFCALDSPDPNAWQRLEGGDGVQLRFVSNGLLIDISPSDNQARLSRWDGSALQDRNVVPVKRPGAGALVVKGDIASVDAPHFRDPETQKPMLAVAATLNFAQQLRTIYGLFANNDVASAEWDLIATLDIDSDDAIISVASLRGDQVFASTRKGRVFSVAPNQKAFELATPLPKAPIRSLVVVRDGLAFAIFDGSPSAILQSDFFNWDPLGSNDNVARGAGLETNGEPFVALAIDRVSTPPALFACTDSRVFVSRDEGDTWKLATTGLPKRVHCTSLAVGAARRDGGRHLYIGTYGRSVWQARLP